MEEQLPTMQPLESDNTPQEMLLSCLEQINQAVLRQQGLEIVFSAFAAGISRQVPFYRLDLACFDPFLSSEFLQVELAEPTRPAQSGLAEPPSRLPVTRRPVRSAERSLWALVRRTRQPLIIPDIHQYRFAALPELIAGGIQALMVLPLPSAGETPELAGCLSFSSRQADAYSRQTADQLEVVLGALAVAVQQAALKDKTARAEAALHDLSLRLLRAHEDQRAILARELHDEVGQALTALKLNLRSMLEAPQPDRPQPPPGAESFSQPSGAAILQDSLRITSELLEKVRSLSIDLHPPMLDDLGLAAALRWYARRAAERGNLELHLSVPDSFPRLARDVEVTFFRIGQEAITNTLRHAGAANLWLQLRQTPEGAIELHVTDDGHGFTAGETGFQAYAERSLGLRTMQERANLLGAQFEIETAPGKGTRVSTIL